MTDNAPIVDVLVVLYGAWHFFMALIIALFVAAWAGLGGGRWRTLAWAAASFVGTLALSYLA
ncbi:MAG: hypothetical protein P4M00_04265 [Azospirillaceae bacterium]|nr:hypothetical protein [Azospirillaceae bacterium]